MAKKQGINLEVKIPEGITVDVENGMVSLKGANGEVKRDMASKVFNVSVKNNSVVFVSERDNKEARKMIGTYAAHLKNMLKGANEGHKYVLKICSGHFPMNVSVTKEEFVVKNILGEKIPRAMKLKKDVSVKVEGEQVVVESADKEAAAGFAAAIELLAKRANYDMRVFQDGIYIINKDGKDVK